MDRPQIDLRVMQLLCSKLCHDLVGPVGAINNGVELARDLAAGMDDEAMDLVATSARQVAERLQFFRVALGLASGAIKTTREARALLTPGVIGAKNQLVWPEAENAEPIQLEDSGLKLLLNMVFLASEALPRGGRIDIYAEPNGGKVELTVTAGGTGASLNSEALRALSGEVSTAELTARIVQPYFANALAANEGTTIGVDYPNTDLLAIRATVRRRELIG